jgi:hypothetical protein
MMDPTINYSIATSYKKQQRAASWDGKMDEQWSMLHCCWGQYHAFVAEGLNQHMEVRNTWYFF